jgi:hypothetical protein
MLPGREDRTRRIQRDHASKIENGSSHAGKSDNGSMAHDRAVFHTHTHTHRQANEDFGGYVGRHYIPKYSTNANDCRMLWTRAIGDSAHYYSNVRKHRVRCLQVDDTLCFCETLWRDLDHRKCEKVDRCQELRLRRASYKSANPRCLNSLIQVATPPP